MASLSVRSTRIAALVVATAILAALAGSARAQATKWNFEKGKVLRYSWTEKSDSQVDGGGAASKTIVTQTAELVWTVDSVDGGKAKITQTIGRMTIKVDAPTTRFRYDTNDKSNVPADPGGALMAKVMDVLVDSKTTFALSDHGLVSNVTPDEKTVAAMGAQNPSLDVLKQVIAQTAILLPDQSLAKGTTWKQTLEVPDPPFGKKNWEIGFTSAGEDRARVPNVLKIAVKSKGKFAVGPVKTKPSKTVRNLHNTGTVLFDGRAGNLRSVKLVEHSTEILNVDGVRVDQTVKKTLTVKRLD